MIYSLQYLRGIAALLVVLYHSRGELNNVYPQNNLGDLLFQQGYIGVDLFFMISGFVIMLSTEKSSSVHEFITKRLFRIYPIYLACLVFSIMAFNIPMDERIIKSLLFINLDLSSGAPWFGYSVVFTAWTLMFEFVFYIIFAISMLISSKYRGIICMILLIAIPTALNIFYSGDVYVSGYHSLQIKTQSIYLDGIISVLSSPMFYEFSVGILIYIIYKNFDFKVIKNLSGWFLLISLSMFVYYLSSGYNGGHGLLGCGVYSFALLFSLVIYEKFNNVKRNEFLIKIGDASYSMYLIHPIVISLLTSGVIGIGIYDKSHGLSNVILILLITSVVSYMMFVLIESKFIKLARIILNYKKTKNNKYSLES